MCDMGVFDKYEKAGEAQEWATITLHTHKLICSKLNVIDWFLRAVRQGRTNM